MKTTKDSKDKYCEDSILSKEYLEKKQKKKKMAKIFEELNQMDIKDDVNWTEDVEPTKTKIKKDLIGNPENIEDLEKANENFAKISKSDPEYEVHKRRTKANVEDYMSKLLQTQKQCKSPINISNISAFTTGVSKGHPIEIAEVIMNDALSVVNIFWNVFDKDLNVVPETSKIVEMLQKNLENVNLLIYVIVLVDKMG
jgi:hypothetical protein